MSRSLAARPVAPGEAVGDALVLAAPLSLWGGVDAATGRIVEADHPLAGVSIAGRVLVMPGGRGSSSSASVLAEMARLGTAPAAIVVGEADLILPIGAAVAEELYDVRIPIVEASLDALRGISTGVQLSVRDGRLLLPD